MLGARDSKTGGVHRQAYEAIGLRIRQRLQHHTVYERADADGCCERNGERCNRASGEEWCAHETAEREACVTCECIETRKAARRSCLLAKALHAAKGDHR